MQFLVIDYTSFWKSMAKAQNKSASKYANVIDNCVGDEEISERWREHFEKLYKCYDNNQPEAKYSVSNFIQNKLNKPTASTRRIQNLFIALCMLKLLF